MPSLLVFSLSFLTVAAPPPALDEATKRDLDAMQGVWRIRSFVPAEGTAAPPPEAMAKLRIIIDGDLMHESKAPDELKDRFTLDATKSPKWLNVTRRVPTKATPPATTPASKPTLPGATATGPKEGTAPAPRSDVVYEKKMSYGIYEIQGDTLRMCFPEAADAEDPAKRPKEFPMRPTSQRTVIVLERVK